MKPFPGRKTVWITVLVCAIVVLLEASIVLRKHRVGLEPLYILQFMALLYFMPRIVTWKKAILYSLVIPFFCCIMAHTAHNVIRDLLKWDIPFYLKEKSLGDIIYALIVNEWVFEPYVFSFSWLVSFFLMLICGLHLHALKHANQTSVKQKTILISPFQQVVMEMRLFRHKKLTFSALLIYIIFMVIYFKLYESFWFENIPTEWTYGFLTYTPLLSFMSLFLLAPVLIGQTKRTVSFCVIAPLLWSIAIFVLWTILMLLFGYYQHIVIKDIFSIQIYPKIYRYQTTTDIFSIYFYLDRYLKTKAWLISFPLLLICGVYYHLAKSELSRKAEMKEDAPSPELSEGD